MMQRAKLINGNEDVKLGVGNGRALSIPLKIIFMYIDKNWNSVWDDVNAFEKLTFFAHF